jgi:hypothetical protein
MTAPAPARKSAGVSVPVLPGDNFSSAYNFDRTLGGSPLGG